MSYIPKIAGAVCVLLAAWFIFFVRKAKTPDPEEKKKEEEFEFDEKVIYMEDYEIVWRKRKNDGL